MKKLIVITLLITSFYSQHREGRRQIQSTTQGSRFFSPKLLQKIGVTENQLKQIKTIRSSFKKEEFKHEAELKTLDLEKRELLHTDGDLKIVESKINQFFDLKAKMEFNRIKNRTELMNILNKDQLSKLKEIRSRRVQNAMSKRQMRKN